MSGIGIIDGLGVIKNTGWKPKIEGVGNATPGTCMFKRVHIFKRNKHCNVKRNKPTCIRNNTFLKVA